LLIGWLAAAGARELDISYMSWWRDRARPREHDGLDRLDGHERGQTLVEFALILPVFLMLTLAVVDGARVFMAQIALTNGVREATLFATRGNYNAWCRNPNDSSQADETMPVTVPCPTGTGSTHYSGDPANLAFRIAIESSGMDRATVVMAQPKCGLGPGAPTSSCSAVTNPKYVSISATYQFSFLTPLLNQLWGQNVTLTATSTGRVQ
jgi:Flp pilus assembly protein TadG